MIDWELTWKRLEDGQHVVLQVKGPTSLPPHAKLRLVRVDCQPWAGPHGALDEACRLVQAARGKSEHPLLDAAAERLKAGLRRHLLGETLDGVELGRYEQALSRDASLDQPPLVLVLQGVEHADPASLILLTRLLTSPHARLLPVLFIFESSDLEGAPARLHQALHERLPREAFCSSDPALAEPGGRGAELTAAASGRLGVAARQVLRAAATIGTHFESCVLAEL
ncbi:MAG TPA: hypothetical protein VG963_21845, partial [Polyangiaceae bacterium]|nr:hypothetical protein [Polyangiaceae bacterium]